jgi:hypothetical protein
MDSQGPEFRAHQENLTKHQELNALIVAIGEALQRRSATIDEVSKMLVLLGDRLVKRFAMEEDGGYFADAIVHAPQLVSKANALLAQHPKMHALAENLALNLQGRNEASNDWWERTAELFGTFREEFARHESQENVLLQEAYQQDIGATD